MLKWHKEGVDTNNKLVYKPMYPGYQDPKKHPEGLCVPCCFTKPVGYGNTGWKKLSSNKWVNNITGEKTNKEPEILLDYMYKAKDGKGPEYKDGKPTRLLLSLRAWGASSKADARAKAKNISARNSNKKKKSLITKTA